MPSLGWKRRETSDKGADGSARAYRDSPGREPLYIDLLADRDGDTAVLIARESIGK